MQRRLSPFDANFGDSFSVPQSQFAGSCFSPSDAPSSVRKLAANSRCDFPEMSLSCLSRQFQTIESLPPVVKQQHSSSQSQEHARAFNVGLAQQSPNQRPSQQQPFANQKLATRASDGQFLHSFNTPYEHKSPFGEPEASQQPSTSKKRVCEAHSLSLSRHLRHQDSAQHRLRPSQLHRHQSVDASWQSDVDFHPPQTGQTQAQAQSQALSQAMSKQTSHSQQQQRSQIVSSSRTIQCNSSVPSNKAPQMAPHQMQSTSFQVKPQASAATTNTNSDSSTTTTTLLTSQLQAATSGLQVDSPVNLLGSINAQAIGKRVLQMPALDGNEVHLPMPSSHRTHSSWMRISSIILTPVGILIVLFIVISPLLHYLM